VRISGKYAALFMDIGAYKRAEEIYSRLYAADTNSQYFLRKLITSYYKQEEFLGLIPFAQKFIALQPVDIDIRLVLITAYQKTDSTMLAVDELNKLLMIEPANLTAIAKMAFIYFSKLKEYDIAAGYYRQLNQMENNSDPTHLTNLGICEFFVGNVDVAAPLLDSLSYVIPTDPMIPFYAGLAYKQVGNADLALRFLERSAFLAVPAYVADVFHHLGRAYSAKRMFTEAFKSFDKVREITPDNYMVLFDIAITHEEFNLNRKEALKYYNQFLEKSVVNSAEAKYAKARVEKIKEQLFFEGK
jgi:tetratricopeptide (TPR) repeat protein